MIDVRQALGWVRLPEWCIDIDALVGTQVRYSHCHRCDTYMIMTHVIPTVLTEDALAVAADSTKVFDLMGKIWDLSEFYQCSYCRTQRDYSGLVGEVTNDKYEFRDGRTLSVIMRSDPQAASRYNLPYPKLEDLN